nr:transposase [Sagittula sp. MA-2]
MEACGTAHYWGRELALLGHDIRLIPPVYVKPFVKRQKNDAADAEAIAEAVQRPNMRMVAVKSAAQQARAMLFRTHDLLVGQRTARPSRRTRHRSGQGHRQRRAPRPSPGRR